MTLPLDTSLRYLCSQPQQPTQPVPQFTSQPAPPECRADRLARARAQAREKARGWVAWGPSAHGGGAAPTRCESHLVRSGPMEENTTWLLEAQLQEARKQLRAQPTPIVPTLTGTVPRGRASEHLSYLPSSLSAALYGRSREEERRRLEEGRHEEEGRHGEEGGGLPSGLSLMADASEIDLSSLQIKPSCELGRQAEVAEAAEGAEGAEVGEPLGVELGLEAGEAGVSFVLKLYFSAWSHRVIKYHTPSTPLPPGCALSPPQNYPPGGSSVDIRYKKSTRL